jgi:ParB-like chromosome segregation protein Spo0J
VKLDDERYRGIEAALRRGLILPPIVAYLLDGDYYVLDGHHRVAAARALGQVFMDAEVVVYRRAPRLVRLNCAGGRPAGAVACARECQAA